MTLQLGWFSTGRDRAARGLLATVIEAIHSGELRARIQFVFSNREPGDSPESDRFLELVRSYGLPLVTLSSSRFRRAVGGDLPSHREEYDQQVMERIAPFSPEVIVLAGYMLIISAPMCQRYTMVNLHPALPHGPKGTWQQVIWQLIGEGARETGAKIHLVTEELDKGPTVTYCTFPIRGEHFDPLWRQVEGRSVAELQATYGENLALFRLIRQHGLAREFPLLLATLRALAERRVAVRGGMVVDVEGRPIEGYCLTEEMDREVARLGLPNAQ